MIFSVQNYFIIIFFFYRLYFLYIWLCHFEIFSFNVSSRNFFGESISCNQKTTFNWESCCFIMKISKLILNMEQGYTLTMQIWKLKAKVIQCVLQDETTGNRWNVITDQVFSFHYNHFPILQVIKIWNDVYW